MTESIRLKRLGAYADLMREIKQRHEVVRALLAGAVNVPPRMAYELAFLQLRMICELVALGCLVVHGDIPTANSKELRKAYSADFILQTLAQLHADFFPHAIRQEETGEIGASGRPVVDLVEKTEGFLTKAELIKLYHQCGNVLHRGSIQQLDTKLETDMSKLPAYVNKIVGLLNQHRIQSIDPEVIYVVVMQREGDGEVEANWLRRIQSDS